MQTRQLEYFLAVAQELSFTRAAKRLFISQAALSMQIKSLETELGVRLFDRDKHHVALTAAGFAFIDSAREIVVKTDEAVRNIQRVGESPRQVLRLGYVKGYERSGLSKMLARFHKSYPQVWVEFTRGNVADLYDALRAERVDVVINMMYSDADMGSIEWQAIGRYPLVAAMRYDHPLASRAIVDIASLRGFPVIKYMMEKSDYGESERILTVTSQQGLYDRVSSATWDIETSILCVLAGFGYALLPGFITTTLSSEGRIVTLPVSGMEQEILVVAAWLPSTSNELIDVFLDEFLLVEGQ